MTIINMDWRKLDLQAEGHAGSAPKGEDLVCCAISAITTTLAEYLINVKGARAKYDMHDGSCRIRAKPLPWKKKQCEEAYKQAMTGLEQLSDQYPEYITVREVLKWPF